MRERVEARLYTKHDDGHATCELCSHNCSINEGRFGICGVRQNRHGTLWTLVYGDPIARNIDPIEKKPLYHVLPGSQSYSIATIGCNFRCGFCQNWHISQLSKETNSEEKPYVAPRTIVDDARRCSCRSISYTYTEPTIFFEYAFDIARLAAEQEIINVFVTNGFMSRIMLDTLHPWLHAANIDLKSFRPAFYRHHCQARLEPVLDSIRAMHEMGIWIEVTTLIIPGENDSVEELKDIASFLSDISSEIPWHISRFHPAYHFPAHARTSMNSVEHAREIGLNAGLRYVYPGNIADRVDTVCPACSALLVSRSYLHVHSRIGHDGKCPDCGTSIAGIWA